MKAIEVLKRRADEIDAQLQNAEERIDRYEADLRDVREFAVDLEAERYELNEAIKRLSPPEFSPPFAPTEIEITR